MIETKQFILEMEERRITNNNQCYEEQFDRYII